MENIERLRFYQWLADAEYDGPVGLTAKFTLDEDKPERVDHAEPPKIDVLADHFQSAQPLTRVKIRPYNAKADKDCAGSKLGRVCPGEE